MPALSYSFRPSVFATDRTYRLQDEHLEWSDARGQHRVTYQDIAKMVVFKERFLGSAASYWCNVLHLRSGEKIKLGAAHRVRFRKIEDRTVTYIPFIKALEARVQSCNPKAPFIRGRYWLNRVENLLGRLAVLVLRGLRRFDPGRSAAFAGRVTRLIGPRLRGHRIARANLAAAFPEKSASELDGILSEMWDNLGRALAEYAHLDRMWDYGLDHPKPGRIIVDQASADRLRRLSTDRRPVVFFGAHLANWELPPMVLPAIGREAAILYRPLNIPALAEELSRIRKKCAGTIIAADAFAVFRLNDAMQRGACIGILPDQHFANGIDVMFFGRSCKVNPMVARLARSFECEIYGGRTIRLPDGRFRYDVVGPIAPPRDDSGKIVVVPTMQMITGIIETWIREHPEQWMWLHHRWRQQPATVAAKPEMTPAH